MKKSIFKLSLLLICNTVSFGQSKLMKTFIKYSGGVDIKPQSFYFETGLHDDSYNYGNELEKLSKALNKHKSKNGEDISSEFVEFFIQLTSIKTSLEQKEYTALQYSNILYEYFNDIDKILGKYSQQEISENGIWIAIGENFLSDFRKKIDYVDDKVFSDIFNKRKYYSDIKQSWDNYFSYLQNVKLKRGSVAYIQRLSQVRDVFFYHPIGKNLYFEPEFYVSDYGYYSKPGYESINNLNKNLEVHPDYNENFNDDFKWGEQYSFLDSNLKYTISKFLYLKNLWINTFKDVINDQLNSLENNVLPDCYIITDYIIDKMNSEKFDAFTLEQLYEIRNFYNDTKSECNLHYSSNRTLREFGTIKRGMKRTLNNFIFNKKNKSTGYCISEKHRERLMEEFYPKNGLKITKGVIKIDLKSDIGCSFTWEVFDTTLSGKTRISYFTTSVPNSDDNEIIVKLDGTDTF